MRKPTVVIKLGGAAITDKKRIYTPNFPVIRSAARQLAAVRKDFSLILVHGAGSYGHIPAKRFGLTGGFRGLSQLPGLSSTKLRLLEWEMLLDSILRQNRVPVIPLIPSDFITTRNGRISTCHLESLKHWLQLGCVPITGGDIVPDEINGFAILSGDQIAVNLAIMLKASRLIFGTDVDGIFDSNPRLNRNAKLLRRVQVSSVGRVGMGATVGVTDVTGGMGGKLRESTVAVQSGIPVFFVNLTKSGRLLKAVNGERTVGSKLIP